MCCRLSICCTTTCTANPRKNWSSLMECQPSAPTFTYFSFLRKSTNSLPHSPLRLEVGPLNTVRGSGKVGQRWCILGSKSAALVAVVFVDFPKNKWNFLHKNKLDIVRRVQYPIGRRPMRSFFCGAVATTALWKSARMEWQPKANAVLISRPGQQYQVD